MAPVTSNLWILTSTTESDTEGITLICPDQAPKSVGIRKPIHVLCLPQVSSAMSQCFHLPHCYKNHQMINILLNTANLNTVNISLPEFWVWQHLEDYWNKTKLHKLDELPTVPVAHLDKHMINNLDTIFSHKDLRYGYRITNTSMTRDILLLFLVLTSHLSMLTFLIRFYGTYYCGWWCRGSTHLQK